MIVIMIIYDDDDGDDDDDDDGDAQNIDSVLACESSETLFELAVSIGFDPAFCDYAAAKAQAKPSKCKTADPRQQLLKETFLLVFVIAVAMFANHHFDHRDDHR